MHPIGNRDALIAAGEDSRHQCKRDIAHVDQLAAELVAFANSAGHLPNHLDTEKIRYGLSNLRNPASASHAFHMLPYRGLGSGIPRAVAACPKLEFIDDRQGNQFKVVAKRGVQQPSVENVGANVGANHLLAYIQTHPGQRASEMTTAYKLTQRTLDRWPKQLKDRNSIEFRGATKTDGYYAKGK